MSVLVSLESESRYKEITRRHCRELRRNVFEAWEYSELHGCLSISGVLIGSGFDIIEIQHSEGLLRTTSDKLSRGVSAFEPGVPAYSHCWLSVLPHFVPRWSLLEIHCGMGNWILLRFTRCCSLTSSGWLISSNSSAVLFRWASMWLGHSCNSMLRILPVLI